MIPRPVIYLAALLLACSLHVDAPEPVVLIEEVPEVEGPDPSDYLPEEREVWYCVNEHIRSSCRPDRIIT